MSLVSGDNFIFYIYNGGTWKPYVCARSGSMAINTETIETTVTGSGNYKTYEPTVHSFTADIDGVISLNVAGSLSIADLQALQLAKTKILCRFIQTSQANDTYIKEAYFFITNSTDTGSFDGVATFNLSLIGTGSITTIFTPPTPTTGEVYRYPAAGDTAPATPGAYTWSTGLTGKDILSIVKDGRGQSDIILSGTPVGNEALYDSATGDITFAVPFEDVETQPYVLYQNS
jgi:predicted secreted protein